MESFTLMAGLAAVTTRKIKLFATAASLVMPPAIVARMASTIDSISNGRFGLNLVTGWQRPEYSQMGLWPGDDFFQHALCLSHRVHPGAARPVGHRAVGLQGPVTSPWTIAA
jgi:alkanesulfonate monooxygenase SsuD/methylene tetrahydromethanopterin reductase-like flavin-dependent oxidoreductase (luciferase family)